MARYNVHFVHAISPKAAPADSIGPIEIRDGAFADRNRLAGELRKAGVLLRGERVRHFRVHADTTVVYPMRTRPWHSIVISPADSYTPAGVDYPGFQHLPRGAK